MRKLKLLTTGRPRTLDDYSVLQDLTTDSIEAGYKNRGAFIIEGCDVSGNDIGAGIVFIDGELMKFPGNTGNSFPVYLAPAAVVDDVTDLYDGGGTLATQTETAAEVVTSVPGAGEYIAMSATGGRTWYDAQADEFVRMKGSQTIAGIKTFASGIITAGVNVVNTLASLTTNKVDKISGKSLSKNDFTDALLSKLNALTAGSWAPVPLINGWSGTLEYRQDTWGVVYVRGTLWPTSATNPEFTTSLPNAGQGLQMISVIINADPQILAWIPYTIGTDGHASFFGASYKPPESYYTFNMSYTT